MRATLAEIDNTARGKPLIRRIDGNIRLPAKSSIHAVLDRHGLVKRGDGRRHHARGTPRSEGTHSDDPWCTDFKGCALPERGVTVHSGQMGYTWGLCGESREGDETC
jgi:hypothetical protein